MRPAIDFFLESHDEAVIKAAVKKARPMSSRGFLKTELRKDAAIKFSEYDMNCNGIRIGGVNSGRIDQIELETAMFGVPPATAAIGKKPKSEPQQVGAGNGRDLVPEEVSVRISGLAKFIAGNPTQAFDALGVNMNFGAGEHRELFQLFD